MATLTSDQFEKLRDEYESGDVSRAQRETEQARDEWEGAGLQSAPLIERIVVQGNPIPKARPVVTRRGAYTPAPTTAWETAVGWAYRGRRNFSGPVALRLRFFRGNHIRVDLDNLVKAICDGLNGVAYEDDAQITHIEADKLYDAANPRCEIEIGGTTN